MSVVKPGDRVKVHKPDSLFFHGELGTVQPDDDPDDLAADGGHDVWVLLDASDDSSDPDPVLDVYGFTFDELRKVKPVST